MTCANNCKGVNPNAVVIGGTAVFAASAVSLQQVVAIGVGVAAAAGGGTAVLAQMMNPGCPATRPCQVGFYFFVLFCSIILSSLIHYLQSNPVVPRDQMAGTLAVEGAADLLGPPVADLDVQLHAENH